MERSHPNSRTSCARWCRAIAGPRRGKFVCLAIIRAFSDYLCARVGSRKENPSKFVWTIIKKFLSNFFGTIPTKIRNRLQIDISILFEKESNQKIEIAFTFITEIRLKFIWNKKKSTLKLDLKNTDGEVGSHF